MYKKKHALIQKYGMAPLVFLVPFCYTVSIGIPVCPSSMSWRNNKPPPTHNTVYQHTQHEVNGWTLQHSAWSMLTLSSYTRSVYRTWDLFHNIPKCTVYKQSMKNTTITNLLLPTPTFYRCYPKFGLYCLRTSRYRFRVLDWSQLPSNHQIWSIGLLHSFFPFFVSVDIIDKLHFTNLNYHGSGSCEVLWHFPRTLQ